MRPGVSREGRAGKATPRARPPLELAPVLGFPEVRVGSGRGSDGAKVLLVKVSGVMNAGRIEKLRALLEQRSPDFRKLVVDLRGAVIPFTRWQTAELVEGIAMAVASHSTLPMCFLVPATAIDGFCLGCLACGYLVGLPAHTFIETRSVFDWCGVDLEHRALPGAPLQ